MTSPTPIGARGENETNLAHLAEASAVTPSDKWALLALAALFVLLLAASWQRWTQPLIDHGREMNLPTRILAGEQLYADVQFLYGPFAPYFNAFLYRVFGVHLATLHASGAVCAALILLMIYWLARQLMSAWEAALAAGLVLVICALKSTANYVQPYAYAALYGLVLALGALICTVRYAQGRGARWLGWAGVCTGLALISKPEIAVAALAAAGVALLLGSLSARRVLWRDAALFVLPVIAIGGGAYGWILSRVPWRVLVEDNHILFSQMPPQLIYFNRHMSGLAQWPSSFWYTVTGLGAFAFWAGLIALLGALVSRRGEIASRSVIKRALGAMAVGIIWWKGLAAIFKVHTDATPLTAALLVLLLVIGMLSWHVWKSWRAGESLPLKHHLLLLITVFSLLSIARAFINVTTTGPYAPFFLPTLLVVYSDLMLRLSSAYFAPPGLARNNARRMMMALFAVLVVGMAINSARRFRALETYQVSAPRGSFLTEPLIGQPLAEAVRYVQQRTSPGDEVLTLPLATTINFLAERRYPLREEIVHPGFLEGEKEAEAMRRLEAHRVPLILITNLLTTEFRDGVFGQDYNQNLMRWITEHYHPAGRFDSAESRHAQFGDLPFFILAYERNP